MISIWDEGGKINEGNKSLFKFFCLGIEVGSRYKYVWLEKLNLCTYVKHLRVTNRREKEWVSFKTVGEKR